MITSIQLNYGNRELYFNNTEQALIKAARAGDLEAFNGIVLKYQDLLFRIACSILGDEDNASDAVQEGLIAAFQHLQSFRDGSLKGWLIRIVVNKCGDQFRSARSRKTISLDVPLSADPEEEDLLFEVRDTGLAVEGSVEKSELEQAIQAGLNALPLNARSVIVLADIEELNYDEISRILNIPVGTVKSRLARARLTLRGILMRNRALLPEKYTHDIA